MYCPKCGTKLAKESVFCHKCGTKMPEELLNAETKDLFETQPAEDYEDLFSYPTEIKEREAIDTVKDTAKNISDFINSDPSVSEAKSVQGGLNFEIPDDWDIEPEKKPGKQENITNSPSVSHDIGFEIPDDWESIDDNSKKASFNDTNYSEDDLNFTIPEDWNI